MPDVEDARRSTVLHDFDKVSPHLSAIDLSLEENRKPMNIVHRCSLDKELLPFTLNR